MILQDKTKRQEQIHLRTQNVRDFRALLIVLGAFYQDAITASWVANDLDVKLEHLAKLERELGLVRAQD